MKIEQLKTPVYLVDENKLEENLQILANIQDHTGCKILLAQKAFSMYRVYPLIGEYLSGATSSGLYEAKLGREEMGGENHIFSPAYTHAEMKEICTICDHISFNSVSQLEKHRRVWEQSAVSVGLRINPEYSTQEGPAIYDPCAPGSRLGIRLSALPNELPQGVEGLHIHTLCEQGVEPLIETVKAVERSFGKYLHEIKWLNLGGGHHITKSNYDIEALKKLICRIQDTYQVQVYLEPGEAVALDAGYFITEVMDIVENDNPILILDGSAACHMPDVLEMPYRPPLKNSGLPGEKKVTCKLGSRTCLAGDIIGEYSFDLLPEVGERLVFEDMAIYSMVKNNTFNGMPLPDIALLKKNGECELIRRFGYEDFKGRLS
jgi:carboxynorspermidine decarboxylase